jgi:hypothetical protein
MLWTMNCDKWLTRPAAPRVNLFADFHVSADMGFLLWLLLFVVCWPLALLALVLYPIVWLILLPFRLLGIVLDGVFEFLRAIVMLPARVLGGGR